jgi:hypothetical protein
MRSNETFAHCRHTSVNFHTSWSRKTPLHYAVRARDSHDIVSSLLKNGADLNILDKFADSPFSIAAGIKPQLDTIKRLLAFGAYPDGGFRSNASVALTPLRNAIQSSKEELAISPIGAGADTRAADNIRYPQPSLTALKLVSLKRLKELVRLLLEHYADFYLNTLLVTIVFMTTAHPSLCIPPWPANIST